MSQSTYTVTTTERPGVQVTVPQDELERLEDLGLIDTIVSANTSTDYVIITDGPLPVGVPDGEVWYNRAAV